MIAESSLVYPDRFRNAEARLKITVHLPVFRWGNTGFFLEAGGKVAAAPEREFVADLLHIKCCPGEEELCLLYFLLPDIGVNRASHDLFEFPGKIIFRIAEAQGKVRDADWFSYVETDIITDIPDLAGTFVSLFCFAHPCHVIIKEFTA